MSNLIERTEILNRFQTIEAEIEKIEKAEPSVYATSHKYVDKIGHIHELKSIKDVVKAKKFINGEFEDFEAEQKELGISAKELENNVATFLGFKKEIWDKDIETRLNELRQQTKLEKLKVARKLLKKNLSEDDKFKLDMSKITELIED